MVEERGIKGLDDFRYIQMEMELPIPNRHLLVKKQAEP